MAVDIKTQILSASQRPGDRPVIGHYELYESLGKGGMGAVFKAQHIHLGKTVAVKLLSGNCLQGDESIERFYREMRAIGALEHQNIVRPTDGGQFDGAHVLVMEYVEGRDLSWHVRKNGPLSIEDACEVVRQTAVGLQYIFDKQLVHRDLKPSNLMVTSDGVVKILDLGLAKLTSGEGRDQLTSTGVVLGTFDYAAPEQTADAREVDIRADIYSLGCTFYHLLCGKPPFADCASNIAKKIVAHAETPVPAIQKLRAEVPDKIVDVLEKMLAKNPRDRYATPADVLTAMSNLDLTSDLKTLSSAFREEQIAQTQAHASSASIRSRFVETDVQDAVPEQAFETAPTESHVEPRRKSRWVSIVAVCCLLMIVIAAGVHFSLSQTPDPNSTPNNSDTKQSPVPPPRPDDKSIVDREKIRIEKLFWSEKEGSRLTVIKANEGEQPDALQCYSTFIGMLKLGELQNEDLRLEMDIEQLDWNGRVGLFFGYQDVLDNDVKQTTYYMTQIEKIDAGHRLTLQWQFFNEKSRNTHGSKSFPKKVSLPRLSIEKHHLSLAISGGKLTSVRLDDDEFLEFADQDDQPRGKYHGAFGIHLVRTSATFSNIMVDGKPIHHLVIMETENE